MENQFVCIEGNIGSGKTTLAKMLSNDLNAKLMLEEFEENPFLKKFYKEPSRYAFQLELSFLAERFQQVQTEIQHLDLFQELVLSDYMIEKCLIFAKNNLDQQSMQLYRKMYDIIIKSTPRPDLIVYLFKETDLLLQNIEKRARPYEQSIKADYLENINHNYLTYFKQQKHYPIVAVDTNVIDFVEDESQVDFFKDLIKESFEVGFHRVKP